MSEEEQALQKLIDGRIARELQPLYEQVVSAYRAGWRGAMQWRKKRRRKKP